MLEQPTSTASETGVKEDVLEICIVGTRQTDRIDGFRRYVEAQGCRAHLSFLNGSLSRVGRPSGGIVIFDEGEDEMTSWLSQIRGHTRYLNVPLVAVSGCTCKDAKARLYAAGASAVCPADADYGHILEEVRQRSDVQPVLTEIRTKLVEPFTYATYVTLREMAGTEVAVESVYRKTDYRMFGDISAVIGLLARTEGFMVLSLPDATAAGLVRRLLAGITDDPDADMVRDGVGEIANVIAGQAKGLLSGTPYQFDLSTPTVVSGAGHEIRHKPGTPCLVIAFTSDLGDFAMQLCLKV